MSRSSDETQQLFDQWADTNDEDLLHPAGPLEGCEHSLAQAAAMVPMMAASTMLDIGIDTGAFVARLAGEGARVRGIDPSSKMLARCQAAHPNFSLAVGAFTSIPHPDRQFGTVVSSFAFHETAPAERPTACAEIARVSRPGGTLCLLDIMFASAAAATEARDHLGRSWDNQEDYPLVGDLDTLHRDAGLRQTRWRQTAPCHWVVLARR